MDFNFRFLGEKSGVDHRDVPTVLAYLDTAGARQRPRQSGFYPRSTVLSGQ